jgi:hypothetical protein
MVYFKKRYRVQDEIYEMILKAQYCSNLITHRGCYRRRDLLLSFASFAGAQQR